MNSSSVGRRGRLPTADKAGREGVVLQAALDELQNNGYERLTMLAVAKRANCSKQTLYSWFNNKEGLLTTLIEKNADETIAKLESAFDTDREPTEVLAGFCIGLISLLTSTQSIALNHAAMLSPELAKILLKSGRYRVGPIVERYFRKLSKAGVLKKTDAKKAFSTLYGLAISDVQIRVLLGEPAPKRASIEMMASHAVSEFMLIMGSNNNIKQS